MFCTRFMKQFNSLRIRQLHSSFIKYENKATSDTASSKPPNPTGHVFGSPLLPVSNYDKRILVWMKRYPSIDKVPEKLSADCLMKTRTQARLYLTFILVGATMTGFLMSALVGRKDVAGGKDVLTERLKWYEEVEEKKEREAANAKPQ